MGWKAAGIGKYLSGVVNNVYSRFAPTIINKFTSSGTTVLGHYPEYVKLAESIGGRTFQIPTKYWNQMSATQQWRANVRFLERTILRGDNIRLATPLNKVKAGSYFEKELHYMFNNGYSISADGLWLIK